MPLLAEVGFSNASYAGDVTAGVAWRMIGSEPSAMLIDVRTPEEWRGVGVPDLASLNRQAVYLSWRNGADYSINDKFPEQLEASLEGVGKDAPLFFLCRVGGRSREAAIEMTARGYLSCYNIEGGFEGPPDSSGERCRIAGWVAEGLPWHRG